MKIVRGLGTVSLFLLIALVCFRSPIMDNAVQDERPPYASPTNHRVGPGEVPSGLSAGDWQAIRKQMVRHRNRIQPASADTYRAVNPAQQLQATFADGGLWVEPSEGSWRWGLRLERYGSVRVPGPPGQVWAEGNRIYYRWDESLTEWFENGERGLEQGFTLQERPPDLGDGQPLALTLAVQGGLLAQANPGGQQLGFHDREGRKHLTYGELMVTDAKGSRVPARLEGERDSVRIIIDDREAVYPLTVDPLVQQAYLKASNTGAGDEFGSYTFAISGDTVVVGARYEDSNATGVNGNGGDNSAPDSGAAYVFVRNGGNWSQQAYLKASNTGAGDWFGLSVAISGDTVVVGAPLENNLAPGAGAAYVFVRNGGNWSQQAYLKASNPGAVDRFGASVAISGDTVVVGAPSEDSKATGVNGNSGDNSAIDAGAAYVFVRNGGNWSQQAYLKASNTGAGDWFGYSVAISGDTVVVGAYAEDSNATGVNGNGGDNSAPDSGAAYVFIRNGGNWSQQAYLKAFDFLNNPGAGDWFGSSVAISGDTVVVGAYAEDSNATGVNGNSGDNSAPFAGAAYVFVRNGGNWSQQAYLKASNTGAWDKFGVSVAISGDTVVVGANAEDSNATGVNGNGGDNSALDAGAAYVFVRNGGNWSQQAYLKASNTDAGDEFGLSVAISGDTVVVGAYHEDSKATGVNGNSADNSAPDAGAAYVFTLNPDLQVTKTNSSSGTVLLGDSFVWTLSVTNRYGKARFSDGQEILNDTLPALGMSYQTITVGDFNNVVNGDDINCFLAGTSLVCKAAGGDVTINIGGGFFVNLTATPTAAATYTNPVAGGKCRVDPDNHILESDETNNDCNSNSVVVDLWKVYLPLILR